MADKKTIDMMRGSQESSEFWTRRRHFLKIFWGTLPTEELNCLSYCYTNVLTFGCSYSAQKMERLNALVKDMVAEMVQEERKIAKAIKKRWAERLEEIGVEKENKDPRGKKKGSAKEMDKKEPLGVEVQGTKQIVATSISSGTSKMKENTPGQSQPMKQPVVNSELLSPRPAPVVRSIGRGLSWLSLFNISDLDGLETARKESEVKEYSNLPGLKQSPMQLPKFELQSHSPRHKVKDKDKSPDKSLTSLPQHKGIGRGIYSPRFEPLVKPTVVPICPHGDSTSVPRKKISTPEKLKAVAARVRELHGISDMSSLDVIKVKEHHGVASLRENNGRKSSSCDAKSMKKGNVKDQRPPLDKKDRQQKREPPKSTGVEKKSTSSAINVLKSAKEKIRQVASAVVGRKTEKQKKEVNIPGQYVPGKYEPMHSLCFENSELMGRPADTIEYSASDSGSSTESWESVEAGEEDFNNNTVYIAGPYASISHARSQLTEELDGSRSRGTRMRETYVPTYTDLLRRYYAKSERDKVKHSGGKHSREHPRKAEANVYQSVVEISGGKSTRVGRGCSSEIPSQKKSLASPEYDVEDHRKKIRTYSELMRTKYSKQRSDERANNNTKEQVSKQWKNEGTTLEEHRDRRASLSEKSPTHIEIQIGRGKSVRYTKDPRPPLERGNQAKGVMPEKLGQQDVTMGICRSRTFVNSNKRSAKKSDANKHNIYSFV